MTYSIASLSVLNDYGPFKPDGTVDWVAVAAIAAVMDTNVQHASGAAGDVQNRMQGRLAENLWTAAVPPANGGLESSRGEGFVGLREEEKRDWAGIESGDEEGIWRGTYAFME